MSLDNTATGIYFLKVRNVKTNQTYIHKFAVNK